MAGDKLFRKPSLAVIQGDTTPMYGVVAAGATVANLKPGKLVVYSTNDGEVDIAGVADISGNVGIAGYEQTPTEYRPKDRDTAYTAGDHLAIHAKPGMRFRGFLTPGTAAVTPGTTLHHADASGNFQKYLGDTSVVTAGLPIPFAKAMESITPDGSVATECWMEWL